jgi:hypothetical protein
VDAVELRLEDCIHNAMECEDCQPYVTARKRKLSLEIKAVLHGDTFNFYDAELVDQIYQGIQKLRG